MDGVIAKELTINDRCDRCGSQAYVRVDMPSTNVLMFCAHHSRTVEANLRPLCVNWDDQTARLHPVVEKATT